MSKAEDTHYVYVISIEGMEMVKVGISRSPIGRLQQLSTGSPFKMKLEHAFAVPNRLIAEEMERGFHHVFRSDRRNGEWFAIAPKRALFGMCVNILVCLHITLDTDDDDEFEAMLDAIGFPPGVAISKDIFKPAQ